MAFSQNHSITYIDVAEPNLLGICRSSQAIVPSDKRWHNHPCEAYICTTRESDLLRVYIAIFDISTRIPLIFTSECDAKETAVFKKMTAEAETFAVSLGFSLEPVNLDYSAAMRQVIMRGICVLRPPVPARLNRKANTAALPDTDTQQTSPQKPCLALVATSLPSVIESFPAASVPPGKALDSIPAVSVEKHALLRLELETLTLEKIAADASAAKTVNDLNARLECALAACKKAEKTLQDESAHRGQLDKQETDELDQVKAELSNADGRRKRAEESCAEESLKRCAAETTVLDLSASLEIVKKEAARRVQELENQLAEARKANEDIVLEKELERQRVGGELKSVTSKLERLSAEKNVWDSIALNFKKKARSAVERLRLEKRALEEELRQLVERGNDAVQPRAAADMSPRAEAFRESPLVAGFSLGPAFTGFAAATAGSVADFHYEPGINTITYHSADDIIDLYGSGNMIQAAPFGRRSQNCSAYICVVERQGRPEINLAWLLVESGEVLICLPENQPEGNGNYARVVQDALFYFESVGFMMDRFELSRGSDRQLQALDKTGIFRCDAGHEGLMAAAA
jgi:hypothetical protein